MPSLWPTVRHEHAEHRQIEIHGRDDLILCFNLSFEDPIRLDAMSNKIYMPAYGQCQGQHDPNGVLKSIFGTSGKPSLPEPEKLEDVDELKKMKIAVIVDCFLTSLFPVLRQANKTLKAQNKPQPRGRDVHSGRKLSGGLPS